MNKNMKIIVGVIIGFIILIFLISILGPLYTLSETELSVITRFGNPVKIAKTAGLHFKIPVLDKVNKLPKWVLEWDGEVKQFPTYDKRMILVDATVRWRISDPLIFFESLTNISTAAGRLDDILDAASRETVSKHTFEELTRTTDRINQLDEKTIDLLLQQGFTKEDLEVFPHIEVGREMLNEDMKKYSINKLEQYGIEIIDFFVKKVNYIDDNLASVYGSMIAERNKIAQAYRSEGKRQEEVWKGRIEKEKAEIMADAQEREKEIRGEADAEATKIYNNAYNRSSSTRDFYEFVKKMEMYKKMPSNTSLIISTESEFFDMFKNY